MKGLIFHLFNMLKTFKGWKVLDFNYNYELTGISGQSMHVLPLTVISCFDSGTVVHVNHLGALFVKEPVFFPQIICLMYYSQDIETYGLPSVTLIAVYIPYPLGWRGSWNQSQLT